MITIHLYNLKFYSFHGVHEEEKLLGNEYEVNADVRFHEDQGGIHSLSQTINYAEVFEIIKKRMHIPTHTHGLPRVMKAAYSSLYIHPVFSPT